MALSDSWVKKEFTPADELEKQRQEALLEEMGLEDRDVNKLRKMMISSNEAITAKKEELTRIRQTKGRKNNWLEFQDIKARMGRVLPACDVIRGLRSIMPQLRCADGQIIRTIALFTPIIRTWEDGFHPGWAYLGWLHSDWNPEYEIDFVDEDGIAKGQRRGWRTTLLNAIIAKDGTGTWVLKANGIVQDGSGQPLKIITEDQALKAFGYPTNGITASNYRRQLWEFRNGKLTNPIAWT